MLSKKELDVLISLATGERDQKTSFDKDEYESVVSTLSEKGLVTRTGSGVLKVGQRKLGIQLQKLSSLVNEIDYLPELLTEPELSACWYAAQEMTPDDCTIVGSSDKPVEGFNTLRKQCLLQKNGSGFRPDLREVGQTSELIIELRAENECRRKTPDKTVVWASPTKALFVSTRQPQQSTGQVGEPLGEKYSPAGITAAREYGVRVRQSPPSVVEYSNSDDSACVEEVACQILRVRPDHRRVSYASVLLSREEYDSSILDVYGRYYGVADIAQSLDTFIKTSGDECECDWFPTWEAVQRVEETV